MVISIQTLCSVWSRSRASNNNNNTWYLYCAFQWPKDADMYSHESSWEWCNKFFTPGFGDPLPSFLADPLQFCQVGWWTSVDSHVPGLSRDAQLGLGQGSGWVSQEWSELFPKPLLCYFSCAQGHCLVGRWTFGPVWGPEDISVLGRIHLSFNCTQSSCPCSWNPPPPHSMLLPPPCVTVGIVLGRWWAVPGFLHTYRLELTPKSSILVSSDQRIFFLVVWESFMW